MTAQCHSTGVQGKMASTCHLVGTLQQKELRTRKNREARRSNHKSGFTLLYHHPPKSLFVAQTTHMAGRDSWGAWIESQTRLPQHKRQPLAGGIAIWHRNKTWPQLLHTSVYYSLSLGHWADNYLARSHKRAPIPQKTKKAYVYI